MASRSDHGPHTEDDLFNGITFWLSRQVPMRSHYQESMKRRGATFVTNESEADMRIVDDARKNPPVGQDYYSYKFVDESMKNNRLENPKKYAVGLKSAADRPVGSMRVTAKKTKKPFTREDDQILFNWLEPYRQNGGFWKGNKIYQQLAHKHPQHTFQSWRSRYLFIVTNCTKMTVTEHIDPFASSDNEDDPGPQERSPKRRRLNGPQPAGSQHPPMTSPRRAPTVPPQRATGLLDSPLRIEPPERAVAASERSESVREDSTGDGKPDGNTEKVAELLTNDPDTLTSTSAPIIPSGLAAWSHADNFRKKNRHGAERQTNASLTHQVSHDSGANSRDDSRSISGIDGSDERTSRRQASETDESPGTVSRLRKFSREEAQELYRAVPYIHIVEPQKLDQSWEDMVQEKGQHTVAEWRLFYETTILPEYMRRNNLETMEDLNNHVVDLLAEEQALILQKQEIKEEPVSGNIPTTAKQTSSELAQIQQETARTSPSRVSQRSRSRESTDADIENDVSADFREPSPVMKPQTILRAVEVRQNGNLIAQESSILQPQPSQPPMTQSSVVSPKKRLFGRTLDAATISSQLQDPKTAVTSARANEASFGTASTTSALVSLPSQSVSSSKRPPESGQRPPKSATTSQEESIAHDAADQEQSEKGVLDVLPDDDRTLSNAIPDILLASDANSPTVDLLWEEAEENNRVPSSPGLSDTGSEYMAFDTAPQRSQLWPVSEDESHDEFINDENEEGSDNESPRNARHSARHTPRKQTRKSPAPRRVATPTSQQSESGEDHLVDEEFETAAEAQGSPEFDIQTTTSVKAVPRTETQILFEQSVPEIEEETTIFDLPPPEGGWEQFSDIEDEIEDIHASVELADLDLSEHRVVSSSSETNEAAAEPLGVGEGRLNTALTREALVISDHESELTTSSGDMESPTPNGITGVQQRKPPAHSVSDRSERTASSSRTASSRMRDHEEDNTENSSTSSEEQSAIESWFAKQPGLHNTLDSHIVRRLASTSLQATVLNLSAATFTLRDMVASFERSEATRRAQFQVDTRIKREYTDSTPQPKFKPKTRLTEEEARSFLPRDVLGVWTIEDDRNFLSQTIEGLEKVKRKHGAVGVRKRAKFLRLRYGEGAVNVSATPKSRLGSTRRQR